MTAVICATGIICSYLLIDRGASWLRLGWLIPMAMLLIGMPDTRSRGGLLASMTLVSVRYGGRVAIVSAVMAACLIPLAAGRQPGLFMAALKPDAQGNGRCIRTPSWKLSEA